jgi:hypothetical protein
MSFSAQGHAIIGLRVPYTQVYEKVKIRSFAHDYPEDWTVDPKSGRKLFHFEWQPKAAFKAEQLGNYTITTVMLAYTYDADDNIDTKKRDYVYVVLATAESSYHSDLGRNPEGTGRATRRLPTPAETLAFKKECEKAGIWNADNFGLWADVSGG